MRTLFLSSSGLNEENTKLFWKYIGKEPINAKAIMVPSAAVGNDGAREGDRKSTRLNSSHRHTSRMPSSA